MEINEKALEAATLAVKKVPSLNGCFVDREGMARAAVVAYLEAAKPQPGEQVRTQEANHDLNPLEGALRYLLLVIEAVLCDPEGQPCFEGSDGDRRVILLAMNQAKTALAALPSAPVQAAWQPISTAPKDGTWVLLAGGDTGEDWMLPEEDKEALKTDVTRPVTAKWESDLMECGYDDGNWFIAYWDNDWRSAYRNPTHWMPLPACPSEK